MFFESDDPVASLARSWNGTWRTIGSRAGSTGISSAEAVLGVVDHEHSGRQHELLAEEGEVGPVERDQHVEMIAVGERLVLADPHAARRLAAANLRPERLQDGGMETFGGRRRDEQLTARDDAVAPGSTTDNDVVGRPARGGRRREWRGGRGDRARVGSGQWIEMRTKSVRKIADDSLEGQAKRVDERRGERATSREWSATDASTSYLACDADRRPSTARSGTTWRHEIVAGTTTFATMATSSS